MLVPTDPNKIPASFHFGDEVFDAKMNLTEAVLRLWQQKTSAEAIMRLLKIDEQQLMEIIPKNLWWHDRWVECRGCAGVGRHNFPFQNRVESDGVES